MLAEVEAVHMAQAHPALVDCQGQAAQVAVAVAVQ
jgi:hypothetical protein